MKEINLDQVLTAFAEEVILSPPPLSKNQVFKKEHGGISKRTLINMRKKGCKTIEQYRAMIKKRKVHEKVITRIKKKEVKAGKKDRK